MNKLLSGPDPKEWILNYNFNRFQLGYRKNVGPLSEEIRKCKPKTVEEWEDYYYNNVRPKEHLTRLGEILYDKIMTIAKRELESITRDDCIKYVIDVVIRRTFEGFWAEMEAVKGRLEQALGVTFYPAPPELEVLAVDWYTVVNGYYLGVQVKPLTFRQSHLVAQIKQQVLIEPHRRFKKKYGGNVFVVITLGKKRKFEIVNEDDLLTRMRKEIERLKSLPTGPFQKLISQ